MRPVKLGDYGYLDGSLFHIVGNIEKDYKIAFSKRPGKLVSKQSFCSKDGVSMVFHPKVRASVPVIGSINASLEICFSCENAVFFHATNCQYSNIDSLTPIGKAILQQYKKKQWEKEFVVVTQLVKSGICNIIVSGSSKASILFEAQKECDEIDLGDTDLLLSATRQNDISYLVESQKDLIPFLGLGKLQSKYPWTPDNFRPHYMSDEMEDDLGDVFNNPENLHFIQID